MKDSIPREIYLPCGGIGEFDGDFSYRCWHCMAVVGSIGQPGHCKEEADKWRAYEEAGMWKWDYNTGEKCAVDSKRSTSRHS